MTVAICLGLLELCWFQTAVWAFISCRTFLYLHSSSGAVKAHDRRVYNNVYGSCLKHCCSFYYSNCASTLHKHHLLFTGIKRLFKYSI